MRQKQRVFSLFLLSPSSRRAWIEITGITQNHNRDTRVALLTEGVDRNLSGTWGVTSPDSRPPHGGRG